VHTTVIQQSRRFPRGAQATHCLGLQEYNHDCFDCFPLAEIRRVLKPGGLVAITVPKPFVWTADPNRIIAAVKRGHQVLDFVQ
jgi:hypothetical protein